MFPRITNAGQFVSPKTSVSIRSCYNFLPLKYNHWVCNNPLWKGRRSSLDVVLSIGFRGEPSRCLTQVN